ncbi:MAG: recombinase zinc beta ribbon domain-containing protein, partial [Sporomusa sp.]
GQLHPGRHSAIIPPEQWEQVQKLLASKKKYQYTVHSGLVSGMIYCGECGARMRTKNVWQNHPCKDPKRVVRYYLCYSQDGSTPYMTKDKNCKCGYKKSEMIDQKLVERLMEYSVNPKLIKEATKELIEHDKSAAATKSLAQAQKEHSALKKKIDRWYDAFERGVLDPDDLMTRVKELRERKYCLEQEIISWQAQLESEQERVQSTDDLFGVLKNFKRLWNESTPEERKSLVQSLVKSIRVYKDDRIEIDIF